MRYFKADICFKIFEEISGFQTKVDEEPDWNLIKHLHKITESKAK